MLETAAHGPNSPAGPESLASRLATQDRFERLGLHLRRATFVSLGVLLVFGFVSGYMATVGHSDCSVDHGTVCRVTKWHAFTVQPREQIDYIRGTDTPHGEFREWYVSGQLAHAGAFDHGKKVSTWREWWPNGTPRFEGAYSRGRLDGRETWWYANGLPEWTGEWSRGLRNGTELWWYENGQLRRLGAFEAGQKHGTFTVWHPDGSLAFTTEHERHASISEH